MRMQATDTIAGLIHDYMVRTGDTEDIVAELIGANQSQVSRWRRGESVPRQEWVEPFAELLGLPKSRLYAARVESERIREERKERANEVAGTTAQLRAQIRRRDAKIRRLEQQLRNLNG